MTAEPQSGSTSTPQNEKKAMSFRLFIYYCALCGGWAAFLGWAAGRLASPGDDLLANGLKGLFLGFFVALGLSLVDALWNLSMKQMGQVFLRVVVALIVGAFGGLLGGLIGQLLYGPTGLSLFLVVGWTLTGFLIGLSIAILELLLSLMQKRDVAGAQKKVTKAALGGTAGGLLGGILYLFLQSAWLSIFSGKTPESLWSPTAWGFVALGVCIGLLIGLAQVILKEAWIRVESGFRPGREKILTKETTTIGRAESCDIGLFGDNTIEKLHASIIQSGNRYFLEDAGTPSGTYLNEQRISSRTPLRSGDLIRVGKSVLCFQERQKRRQEVTEPAQPQAVAGS
jgi:hypothetical protein